MARLTVLLSTFFALLQVALSAVISDGRYRILQQDQQISAGKKVVNFPVFLYPENKDLEQVWHIRSIDEDHITITSSVPSNYLIVHSLSTGVVVIDRKQQKWRLQKSEKQGFYNILLPEGLTEDVAIGILPDTPEPHILALQPIYGPGNDTIHWEFQQVE
ncbi:hypothetical protein BX616_007189 [Lobosporangium transversale]|uniref:Ricin B lectin domain-containing protein n=1 Tax=Lobosporangium transversale TaxID=64571 RepID=A0A1Y2GGX4_9FUNG|nr:hypothetical protein BCR41DRAFT_372376 [Lobosporangium transversale]KAF9914966.1 hypothetical protein BX616_007189 [Lobosporangium transversale]ORZ10638.1 hypothetical protein BCR41DRAFT_372376 [Lobosporangium transversale]|eukprot:XP_021879359.1 hypothetical protein BCR41DRAFT_372376 [Lobosporangium transversale]